MKKKELTKGITLISLIVTIIILLILVGVVLANLNGKNGILGKVGYTTEENEKQTATEKINLKITNVQIEGYTEKQKLPSLQYLADKLYEDDEIAYIYKESQLNASKEKIELTEEDKFIYTKLKEYPYEFQINKNLQLAAIDGIKIATNEESITVNKKEWEELKSTVNELKAEMGEAKTIELEFDRENWIQEE